MKPPQERAEGEPVGCYGLMCPKRSWCDLYASLGLFDGYVIESCQVGSTWPLFRPTNPVQ
jgi:hypothetical protein